MRRWGLGLGIVVACVASCTTGDRDGDSGSATETLGDTEDDGDPGALDDDDDESAQEGGDGADDDDNDASSANDESSGADETGDESGSETGDAGDDDDDDDVGDDDDDSVSDTDGALMGCQKVDFLFVVDNSVSMGDEQLALTTAFPNFMSTIQSTLTATDYHIMVADTDAETRCTPDACSGSPHSTCEGSSSYACTETFDSCDTTRGAGVVKPAGQGASNTTCSIDGDQRYIVDGQSDLSDTFACMATVGLAGHASERPMDAIVEAISDPLNGAGGCNEGFLRDDAILVVTFISDDPNVEDVYTAEQAYDAVIAAKGGDTDRTVVMGLIPTPGEGCRDDKPGAGDHWTDFLSRFGERGIRGPVCATDYNTFFQDAVEIIDETCAINPQ